MTNHGSESLSGNSQATINPGIYSQITVSGNASLTLNPGIYIIEGGGFTVTGNASVSGSGVMIYNAGSNYPSSGGNFGGITLSGNGTFNLTRPDHRDLRRHPDLPVAPEHAGPVLQRQRHGRHDRHHLCRQCPALA